MSITYQPNAIVVANTKVPTEPVNNNNSSDKNDSPSDSEGKNINADKPNEGAGK
jgi:hypothetical protein